MKIFLFVLLILLGSLLRIHALSPFTFYPDAYQNLLVAENIKNFGSVVGTLGEGGMVYPPFVMWSRPIYPVLILLFQNFITDTSKAAQFITVTAGILALPLSFFVYKALFRSARYGIAALLLLAFSFNHTVWSGYLMTETTGVFFMLLLLWSLFSSLDKPTHLAAWRDLVTGILLTINIFTRYEYAVIVPLLIIFIFLKSTNPITRILNITTAAFVTGILIFANLFPIRETVSLLFTQAQPVLSSALIVLVLFLIAISVYYLITKKRTLNTGNSITQITRIALSTFALLLVCQILFPAFSLFRIPFASIRDFVVNDLLISSMTFMGLLFLLKDKEKRILAYLVLASAFILGIIYHRINPAMERYWTHLIPFFLIPASYGFVSLFDRVKQSKLKTILAVGVLSIVLIYQFSLSYQGFRNWGDKSWYAVSYEEQAAKKLKKLLPPDTGMLLVSFPEPYYYFIKVPTQSIADTYPFVFFDDTNKEKKIVLVQDMGMHDIFPKFSQFITSNLSEYKKQSFFVHAPYHYADRSEEEKYPIILYEMTLGELKEKIQEKNNF